MDTEAAASTTDRLGNDALVDPGRARRVSPKPGSGPKKLLIGADFAVGFCKMAKKAEILIPGIVGRCGHVEAFMGFAPARVLHGISFADVLNEDTGAGYQRPRSVAHSRSFLRYITQPETSTIPLTFNLRNDLAAHWRVRRQSNGAAVLEVVSGTQCLAQVDCQHRLGEMHDQDIPLAFMTFIGLDFRAEMAMFHVINSRARGLSSSLTDYHETQLLADVAAEAPHLYLAKRLNEDPASPWHRLVRFGGESSSGLMRRTSFRMLQTSIDRFLKSVRGHELGDVHAIYGLIVLFWKAVKDVFPDAWNDHRHHLLTKGIGLYSLMLLLADFVKKARTPDLSQEWFVCQLRPLVNSVDWSSRGTFAEAGGKKGAIEAYHALRRAAGI